MAIKFGVSTRQISSAVEVQKFLPEAYQSLIDTGKAQIGGRYTSSLQTISRYINSNMKEGKKVKDRTDSTLDYDKLISTEKGKEVFWMLYDENVRPNTLLAEHLILYVNLRFVIEEE